MVLVESRCARQERLQDVVVSQRAVEGMHFVNEPGEGPRALAVAADFQELEPESGRPHIALHELSVQVHRDPGAVERERHVLKEIRGGPDEDGQIVVPGVQAQVARSIQLDLERVRILTRATG